MKIQTYYYFLLQNQKPDSWPALSKERNEEVKMKISFRKIQEISAKGFTRLIGNGTEFKKVRVTYILAITCGFGFYPLHTYLNGRTIGAFDDICNIRHLFVAYF